ncbi:hypothetical protein DPMN_012839 [Dreissena polymorpha]|uniref:Uncharacterized protein n=1 Tax=Dreissena polymorpha TaxID=45954 RepID=A0A9D4N7S8_DREPO|nr:hypothetical protein DPMN_012839 [Dreissena polymorpha]
MAIEGIQEPTKHRLHVEMRRRLKGIKEPTKRRLHVEMRWRLKANRNLPNTGYTSR